MTDPSTSRPGGGRDLSPIYAPPDERPSTLREHAWPERAGKPVHLKDIHLERGMQCVDCHFKQDNHGNGNLYGEPRNAVEIDVRRLPRHGAAPRRTATTRCGRR